MIVNNTRLNPNGITYFGKGEYHVEVRNACALETFRQLMRD